MKLYLFQVWLLTEEIYQNGTEHPATRNLSHIPPQQLTASSLAEVLQPLSLIYILGKNLYNEVSVDRHAAGLPEEAFGAIQKMRCLVI